MALPVLETRSKLLNVTHPMHVFDATIKQTMQLKLQENRTIIPKRFDGPWPDPEPNQTKC